jgi:hypothetical protein
MRKSGLICLFLLFALLWADSAFAQAKRRRENFRENHSPFGGRKKERRNVRGSKVFARRGGLFKRQVSRGNADAFALNSIRGKRGILAQIFGTSKGHNASLRKTRPGKVQNREQRALFKRHRTMGKNRHERILKRQNRLRSGRRNRGNDVFHHRK